MFRSILNQSLNTVAGLAVISARAVVRKAMVGAAELAVPVIAVVTPIARVAVDLAALRRNLKTSDLSW